MDWYLPFVDKLARLPKMYQNVWLYFPTNLIEWNPYVCWSYPPCLDSDRPSPGSGSNLARGECHHSERRSFTTLCGGVETSAMLRKPVPSPSAVRGTVAWPSQPWYWLEGMADGGGWSLSSPIGCVPEKCGSYSNVYKYKNHINMKLYKYINLKI
jgi:hypothetical protein